jgi:hypothetical protein
VVSWLILQTARQEHEESGESSANPRLLPLILSGGAVAIKLNAAPLLIISLLFYLSGKQPLSRKLAPAIVVVSMTIIPVLVAGLITSGCAFYPSPLLCYEFPWSAGAGLAGKMNTINQNYERWMQYEAPENANWIIPWAKRNLDSVVFITSLIVSALVSLSAKSVKATRGRLWLIALGTLGILFVMCSVPARRFALGYFALSPALIAPLYSRIAYPLIVIIPLAFQANPYTRPARFILLLLCFVIYAYVLLTRSTLGQKMATSGFIIIAALFPLKALIAAGGSNVLANGKDSSFWLIPPAVTKSELEIWESKQVNDLKYTESLRPFPDGRCWAAQLPCTPWLLHENIKLRDPRRGLGGGVVRAD